jgi:galactonate dehydratase
MHVRRHKLTQSIALQASAATATDPHQITEFQMFPLREPVSGRTYTVVRLRTKSGLTGYGECARASAAEADKARRAILGKPATSYGVTSTQTSLDGAITTAMIDIAAKAAKAPAYRLLGGPTRTKVRALASLTGATDDELKTSMSAAQRAGYRAFQVPVPTINARNQGQAFDRAVRARMEGLRSGTENVDFVLDGGGRLSAGDAASVAASLERFHLLWFDEPCAATNLRTIHKISDECVTPIGFGRDITEASLFQDLLREGAVDILRPDLQRSGIPVIRRIAAMAETYYTAVAPNHHGGPVGTAVAIQLAASLPNFFIQHVPFPAAEQDRRMRAELVSAEIETVRDGFLGLPTAAGLGIQVNEAALEKYKDGNA